MLADRLSLVEAPATIKAWVNGFRRVFVGRSRKWQGPTASLERERGAKVNGSLSVLNVDWLNILDQFEGATKAESPFAQNGNIYRRMWVQVQLHQGESTWAVVYIRCKHAEGGVPTEAYLQACVATEREVWGNESQPILKVYGAGGKEMGVYSRKLSANEELAWCWTGASPAEVLGSALPTASTRKTQLYGGFRFKYTTTHKCQSIMAALQHADAEVISALGMPWKAKVNRSLGSGQEAFVVPLFTTGVDYYPGVNVWSARSIYYVFTDRELRFMHEVRSNDGRYTQRLGLSYRVLRDVMFALAYEQRIGCMLSQQKNRAPDHVQAPLYRRGREFSMPHAPAPTPFINPFDGVDPQPVTPEQLLWMWDLRTRDTRFSLPSWLAGSGDVKARDEEVKEYLYLRQVEALAWAQRAAIKAASYATSVAYAAMEAAFHARQLRIAAGARFSS
jgi:hypothetical protein